jgi:hypothetical protein
MKRKQILVVSGLQQSPPLSIDFKSLNAAIRIKDLDESGGDGL